jgi:VanZ family protein
VGILLSGATEFLQVFSTARYPETADLVTNMVGVWIGLWLARRGDDKRA